MKKFLFDFIIVMRQNESRVEREGGILSFEKSRENIVSLGKWKGELLLCDISKIPGWVECTFVVCGFLKWNLFLN